MSATTRTFTGLALGLLALLVRGRGQRRNGDRTFREEIEDSYDRAGSDPAFQADMRQVNEEYDGTLADGLDDWSPAR